MLAYLDPATGSLLVQLLIAILAATATVFRRYLLYPLRWLFGSEKPVPEEEQQQAPDE